MIGGATAGAKPACARKVQSMKLHDNTGISYKYALDGALRDLQARYGITRAEARKLFAEAIVRNCVWDEIVSMCDWQMERDVQE